MSLNSGIVHWLFLLLNYLQLNIWQLNIQHSQHLKKQKSTKLIIKTWTNIQLFRRFDLEFCQTSKQIYRRLQYKEKVFEEFQALPHFLIKMFLYLSTKFWHSEALKTNIPWPRRFNLGFWKTSESIYRRLQYKEKVFEEFQALPAFSKMVLYSSTDFGILKSWSNIQLLRRFDLGFWQSPKEIYRKLQYSKKVFEEFQALPCFSEKWYPIRRKPWHC